MYNLQTRVNKTQQQFGSMETRVHKNVTHRKLNLTTAILGCGTRVYLCRHEISPTSSRDSLELIISTCDTAVPISVARASCVQANASLYLPRCGSVCLFTVAM